MGFDRTGLAAKALAAACTRQFLAQDLHDDDDVTETDSNDSSLRITSSVPFSSSYPLVKGRVPKWLTSPFLQPRCEVARFRCRLAVRVNGARPF